MGLPYTARDCGDMLAQLGVETQQKELWRNQGDNKKRGRVTRHTPSSYKIVYLTKNLYYVSITC